MLQPILPALRISQQRLNLQILPIKESDKETAFGSQIDTCFYYSLISLALAQQPHLLAHQPVHLFRKVILLQQIYAPAAFLNYVVIDLLQSSPNQVVFLPHTLLKVQPRQGLTEDSQFTRSDQSKGKAERGAGGSGEAQCLMNFESLKEEFFVGEKKQFVPAIHFLIDLLELLHIGGKQIEQLEMQFNLLRCLRFCPLRFVNLTTQQQTDFLLSFQSLLPHLQHHPPVPRSCFIAPRCLRRQFSRLADNNFVRVTPTWFFRRGQNLSLNRTTALVTSRPHRFK